MCGLWSANWLLSLTAVVVFLGLLGGGVVLLLRSFGHRRDRGDDERL